MSISNHRLLDLANAITFSKTDTSNNPGITHIIYACGDNRPKRAGRELCIGEHRPSGHSDLKFGFTTVDDRLEIWQVLRRDTFAC